ncbi:MAG TPA: DUF4250 domain-containing protein [Defluviitaleaceae bacterium]|nr:DUF4250 domain-containing protein [Candidatus Epulonipiscium sp.]HOA79916.1 DUF4250 domain-containing protein [Defluviitaleaceae bacterium]
MYYFVPLEDNYILLSWLNMKLRNECKSFEQLCERYNVKEEEILEKMKSIGYTYDNDLNKFTAIIKEDN